MGRGIGCPLVGWGGEGGRVRRLRDVGSPLRMSPSRCSHFGTAPPAGSMTLGVGARRFPFFPPGGGGGIRGFLFIVCFCGQRPCGGYGGRRIHGLPPLGAPRRAQAGPAPPPDGRWQFSCVGDFVVTMTRPSRPCAHASRENQCNRCPSPSSGHSTTITTAREGGTPRSCNVHTPPFARTTTEVFVCTTFAIRKLSGSTKIKFSCDLGLGMVLWGMPRRCHAAVLSGSVFSGLVRHHLRL